MPKKGRLQKKLVKAIKILLKKINKKWWYGHERYKNIPEGEKQKLVEYRKYIIKHGKKKP